MAHALTLPSVYLLTMLFVACAPIEPETGADSAPALSPSLQAYTAGDEVAFVLLVLNTTDEPIDITFPSGQSFDFVVTGAGDEIWRWSAERLFTQAVRTERVEPGEALSYQASWQPEEGHRGEFTVVGRLTSSDHPVEQSTRISLP
jgi:hypothetical protein